MKREITIGLAVVAGAALLEVALNSRHHSGRRGLPRAAVSTRHETARRNTKAPQDRTRPRAKWL